MNKRTDDARAAPWPPKASLAVVVACAVFVGCLTYAVLSRDAELGLRFVTVGAIISVAGALAFKRSVWAALTVGMGGLGLSFWLFVMIAIGAALGKEHRASWRDDLLGTILWGCVVVGVAGFIAVIVKGVRGLA